MPDPKRPTQRVRRALAIQKIARDRERAADEEASAEALARALAEERRVHQDSIANSMHHMGAILQSAAASKFGTRPSWPSCMSHGVAADHHDSRERRYDDI